MTKLTKEEIKKISDKVNSENLYDTCHDRTGEIYYNGRSITVQPRPCQAYVSSYSNPRVIGTAITKSYTQGNQKDEHVEGKQEFLHFILGLDKEPSPYQKLINYLGDRLHIVYKDGDKKTIIGYYVEDPSDINHKFIVNFLKANRTVTEHADRMPLWMQLKDFGNKSLAYMLMYYFTGKGEHAGQTSHSPVESAYIGAECNLKNFAQPLENNWNLTYDPGKQSYTGENKHCWGFGKFNPLKHIRSADYKDVKTFFWSKYNVTTPKRMDIASFKKFIEDVNKGLYNEYM